MVLGQLREHWAGIQALGPSLLSYDSSASVFSSVANYSKHFDAASHCFEHLAYINPFDFLPQPYEEDTDYHLLLAGETEAGES